MSKKPKTLAEIYASLPTVECQGKCQEACGPIYFLPAEVDLLKEAGQAFPHCRDNAQTGRLSCSSLDSEGKCSIYANRPLICRLFGVSKKLRCPFGCKPTQWIAESDSVKAMKAIRKLKEGAPRPTLSPLQIS